MIWTWKHVLDCWAVSYSASVNCWCWCCGQAGITLETALDPFWMWYEVNRKWTGGIMLKWRIDCIEASASKSFSCQLAVWMCVKKNPNRTNREIGAAITAVFLKNPPPCCSLVTLRYDRSITDLHKDAHCMRRFDWFVFDMLGIGTGIFVQIFCVHMHLSVRSCGQNRLGEVNVTLAICLCAACFGSNLV